MLSLQIFHTQYVFDINEQNIFFFLVSKIFKYLLLLFSKVNIVVILNQWNIIKIPRIKIIIPVKFNFLFYILFIKIIIDKTIISIKINM